MENDWTKIRTYNNAIESEIVKQMLEEHGLKAVLLNKQDSSYLFGRIELYVPQEEVQEAESLINDYGATSQNPTDAD
ncbi:DUF2007 domain-containing protein [Sphingobacterium alkalisoli]|uniref:DUF2007 domain-containing protein n=1 Tax=Sphingobacterium alkalisoli TaxID=1874115 RepID=A0A4U0H825_9SPHI|nr:DUF2007 domain-containing protein [Sphingobacterium alkalisoli]TJY67888.1 DUF2007 domain-containing protein [Sphingobacterium alkalisoli]GGH10663.1 hypothetical protein GCM10011418_09120 [Sphingobacterium alkalisoli]